MRHGITMREMPEGDFDVVFYLNDGSKHKVSYQSSTAGGRVLTKEELFSHVIKPEVVSLGADRVYVKLDDENGVSSMSFMSEGLEECLLVSASMTGSLLWTKIACRHRWNLHSQRVTLWVVRRLILL